MRLAIKDLLLLTLTSAAGVAWLRWLMGPDAGREAPGPIILVALIYGLLLYGLLVSAARWRQGSRDRLEGGHWLLLGQGFGLAFEMLTMTLVKLGMAMFLVPWLGYGIAGSLVTAGVLLAGSARTRSSRWWRIALGIVALVQAVQPWIYSLPRPSLLLNGTALVSVVVAVGLDRARKIQGSLLHWTGVIAFGLMAGLPLVW